ncbi:Transient receptor potential cation channel subfamily A member 1 [Cytospora mali]|uniref:Transient receptor potential cation channel subfamily A member 1 n=1 Tax=Cytospora mali TaxID=578113 RepID=A0A194VCN4_CYTMA|nr:Transient receptor potential cation channel subfamily A member 1 [Valsa mali var. pyri (nom. inval.)]
MSIQTPTESILSWLPTELFIHILSDSHFSPRDRANISLTCRLFHAINTPILYTDNIRHGNSSCLFWAARHGRIATIQNAVAAGAHLNINGWLAEDEVDDGDDDNAGRATTPLHVAAKYGQREVAEWLIDNGADINAASYKYCDALVVYWRQYFTPVWRPGWTPLFAALNHEQASTAELLVSRRAELTNTHTGRRQLFVPALHVAAANGMSSVIKLLSAASDFDVSSRDFNGNTALHYASQYWPQSKDDVQLASSPIPLLLSLGADIEAVNNRLQNPLIHACWMGNFCAATLLVKAGANPKAECYVPQVQKLVRPVYLASLSRSDIARQSGSEPYQDESALEAARAEFFHALLTAGVNPSDRLSFSRSFDIPMLQRLCLDNNHFAAKTLIHVAGADVNATDGKGQTALLGYLRSFGQRPTYSSTSHVTSEILALLLSSGARLDVPDGNGIDALQLTLDWVLTDNDPSNCLQTLLQNASDSSVSKVRVVAAIDSCYDKAAIPSQRAVALLLDFLETRWNH